MKAYWMVFCRNARCESGPWRPFERFDSARAWAEHRAKESESVTLIGFSEAHRGYVPVAQWVDGKSVYLTPSTVKDGIEL